jgi:hypothetical protein
MKPGKVGAIQARPKDRSAERDLSIDPKPLTRQRKSTAGGKNGEDDGERRLGQLNGKDAR